MLAGLEQDTRRGVNAPELLATAISGKTLFASVAGSGSVQYACLLGFIGRTSLGRGRLSDVIYAEHVLDLALAELEHAPVWNRQVVHTYIDCALSLAVSLKARGQDDDARHLLRSVVNDPDLGYYRDEWDAIPLVRQDVMMAETARAHKQLGEVAQPYSKIGGTEYYGCVKRVFEFVLNRGSRRDAEALFPLLIRTYRKVQHEMTPLARVSFVKNAAQYFGITGNSSRAKKLLSIARQDATARQLIGQMRQIDLLNEAVSAGEHPILTTYRVATV